MLEALKSPLVKSIEELRKVYHDIFPLLRAEKNRELQKKVRSASALLYLIERHAQETEEQLVEEMEATEGITWHLK